MATTKEALMDLPVFDTRKYVQTLTRKKSFSEKQANANADGLQEALQGVATKADIKEVKADIRRLEEKMDVRFQAMQEQMQGMRQLMVVGFSVIAIVVGAATLFG